ncbi:MAG TPA: carboxypeptidase-like regulatory domain-containing protein, partial [Niastella sp.]
MRNFKAYFLTLLTLCVGILAGHSQVTTSNMSGTIKDGKGQPLTGASILAIHTPTGTTYATMTRAGGRFDLSNIRSGGPYKVEI